MVISTGMYSAAIVTGLIVAVTVVGCLLTIVTILARPSLRKLVNAPLVSLSCADILFAICGPALWISHFLHPQWEPPAKLCWFESYALIQNHVRKSRKRVSANAEHNTDRNLAVQFSRGERGGARGTGDDVSPSTSIATVQSINSSRNASDGGVWTEEDKASSGDDEQSVGDQNKPAKPLVIFLASPVPNQARTDKHQHASSHNNAAERQITKMMMTLFAVYTACCMPMTVMVMFYNTVPSEALMVGNVLMALNGALNPIVYGLMNKNIRQGYKHIWGSILNYIT
ncbi:Hypp2945 [Branchiostoma lanceolatum]|uniref:Hypp2945 protein n=1 Tax=Branchiostoma lanceolatum TaxID=7740 RepID=A0A8K0EVM9_BRALA|nr:Hypp2945 [Branchiostoma lanceolatum]